MYFSKQFRKGVEDVNSFNCASVRPLSIFDRKISNEAQLVITHCDTTNVTIMVSTKVAEVSLRNFKGVSCFFLYKYLEITGIPR